MAPTIPPEISGQRYISLATFRKNGTPVYTPVWFGEENGHLYVMTSSKTGKAKRLRNNPEVRIAPSTMRGKVTGPEFSAKVRQGPPLDDEEDYAFPTWAGVVPLKMVAGEPINDPRLNSSHAVPGYAQSYTRGAHE